MHVNNLVGLHSTSSDEVTSLGVRCGEKEGSSHRFQPPRADAMQRLQPENVQTFSSKATDRRSRLATRARAWNYVGGQKAGGMCLGYAGPQGRRKASCRSSPTSPKERCCQRSTAKRISAEMALRVNLLAFEGPAASS